jgi:tRNA threonylcarbamoyladenosine biosynthesis protein TsaB
VALAVEGVAGLMLTWATQRNHSVELLPHIERLLAEAGRAKSDIEAVFVDTGPGGYAALRVGVSIAKALAHGLSVPLVGVGRLELDAHGVSRDAGERRIVAVHRAGRGEVAWATYRAEAGSLVEESTPRILKTEAFDSELRAGDVLTGDIDDALAAVAQRAGAAVMLAQQHRVVALAALGHGRRAAGRTDDPAALVPLYLRTPAIGPQRS